MPKRDNPAKSNQAAAKALELAKQNSVVSDFRKDSEVFQFLMSRRSAISDIDDFVGALQRDYVCGFINSEDVATYISPIDTAVRLKLLELRLGMVRKQLGSLPEAG